LPDGENTRKLASGLIIPSDLPDAKIQGNSQVVSLFQATCLSRLIVPGDLPDGENIDFFL
jgi:hypothetical protein